MFNQNEPPVGACLAFYYNTEKSTLEFYLITDKIFYDDLVTQKNRYPDDIFIFTVHGNVKLSDLDEIQLEKYLREIIKNKYGTKENNPKNLYLSMKPMTDEIAFFTPLETDLEKDEF